MVNQSGQATNVIDRHFPWLRSMIVDHDRSLFVADAAQHAMAEDLATAWDGADDKISLLNQFEARYGEDFVGMLDTLLGESTRRDWARTAAGRPTQDISDLIDLLWMPLRAQGFDFTIDERSTSVQFHCTKCPVADLAKTLPGKDAPGWMYRMFCRGDYAIVEGFNPKMRFQRTKTLMLGDDECDHLYSMEA